MKKNLDRACSLKLIDIFLAVSVFGLAVISLAILLPAAVIFAKGKSANKDSGRKVSGDSVVKITSISPEMGQSAQQ